MIDPFTAVAAATTAFNTVKKFVHAGQDFENCMGQMGKWYTNVSDFRKGQQMQKNQPVFRKLLASGSVEEEALNLLIHDKKVRRWRKSYRKCLTLDLVIKPGMNLNNFSVRSAQTDRSKYTMLLNAGNRL